MSSFDPVYVIVSLIVVMISLTFHEYAHAAAANMLGDSTAKRMGRMSLNPIVHIDPIGTVLLPIMLSIMGLGVFGWAKPVPVNLGNLRNTRRDQALVSIAGPAANLGLAVIGALLIRLLLTTGNPTEGRVFVLIVLISFLRINIFLMAFNLLPIMPLDGSGVIQFFMSPKALFSYQQLSQKLMMVFLIIILMTNWIYTFYLRPVSNLFFYVLQPLAGIQLVQ
jgi:Zn-dependent protease